MNVTSWTLHEPLFMIYSWTLVHEYCIHEQFMNNSHLMLMSNFMNYSWICSWNSSWIIHELFMIFFAWDWLGKFVDASGLFANFEKLGYKCKITFLELRGATDSSFRRADVMARIRRESPHLVLVLLDSNDCYRSSCSQQLVASGLCLLATKLLAIGVKQLFFGLLLMKSFLYN